MSFQFFRANQKLITMVTTSASAATTLRTKPLHHVKAPSRAFQPDLFKRLDADGIAYHLETMDACQGQNLFLEGNIPTHLYLVTSGKIKIYKTAVDGKEQILSIARQGDFFGYANLMARTRHSTSATALEESTIERLSREEFLHLIATNENFQRHFTQLILDDVSQSQKKIVELAYKPVRSRLAEALLSFTKQGYEDGSQINLTREDLARYVGTAKETTIRLLSDFKRKGYIDIRGRLIIIKNGRALQKIEQLLN